MNSSNFPISCFVCDPPLMVKGDQAYLSHMQTIHGGMTAGQAIEQKKVIEQNVPKEIPLNKDTPPSQEFMEIAKMMDQPRQNLAPVIKPAMDSPVLTNARDKKPVLLKYRYEGNCEICNTPVRTIMVEINAHLFAVAYCLTHEEVKQIEVHPIYDMKVSPLTPLGEELDNHKAHIDLFAAAKRNGYIDPFEEIAKRDIRLHAEWIDKQEIKNRILERRKEALKRNDKRHKSKLRNKTTISPTV